MLFLCSWLARFWYLKPKEEHVDDILRYFFQCNSTLSNDNTLYNVDCRYDEDHSLSSGTSIIRTEDATMPCFNVLGNEIGPNYAGVSQNFERARNRFQKL